MRVIADRYAIRDVIGQGGMGRVWRAHDQMLDREVALKEVLLPEGMAEAAKAQMSERMLREARFGARLRHPAIVRVHDVLIVDSRPWIVMELVDGRSLEELIEAEGALPVAQVADIGLSLLGALQAAHKAGVIHRDVKPANVLVEPDGSVSLTDFGIAYELEQSSLTATGTMIGSPQFMAPERVRGDKPGPASDIFSLGATLYAAVEGRSPFVRTGQLATLAAVLSDAPDAFASAGQLQPVLAGMLEKDPARRMDADAVEDALRSVAAVESSVSTGDDLPVPARIPASAPTAVLPAATEPVATPGVGAVPPLEPAATQAELTEALPVPAAAPAKRRSRLILLGAAAVVVVVVIAAGAVWALTSGHRPTASTSSGNTAPATSSGTLTPIAPFTVGKVSITIPAGWVRVGGSDEQPVAGYAKAVADRNQQVVIQLASPTGPTAKTPLSWFQAAQSVALTAQPGYALIVLEKVNFSDSKPTADIRWEWTWTDGGVKRHVLQFGQLYQGAFYVLSFAGPEADFQANGQLFTNVYKSSPTNQ
ncbi:serine/threonine-protein kinase [Fodinicola feengrottensis]|uniref:serine/threonine-protein kinase n=1 Tax=Fodinicola feengrottensis TaxID=435914 RepID=UPI0031E2A3FA